MVPDKPLAPITAKTMTETDILNQWLDDTYHYNSVVINNNALQMWIINNCKN